MSHTFHQKFMTLTALAAASTMWLAMPASAATADTAATMSVPSAVDSSQRVVRSRTSTSAIMPSAQTSLPMSTSTSAVANSTQALPRTPAYQPNIIANSGTDISRGQLANVPAPQANISNISFISTVMVPKTQGSATDQLDVSLMDDFIEEVSPNARHYPPNFPNRSQRYYAREQIKVLTDYIDPYASAPNASYEILIRAAKLNGMGRNLDLGSDYVIRGGKYVDRAIKAQPNSGEANFLYGMMLAEGGGFKEGQKYLDVAVGLGYTEAEQSLAQSDVLSDRRSQALDRLRSLQQRLPNDDIIRQQIKMVEDGGYYIWDISAPNINLKPPVTANRSN